MALFSKKDTTKTDEEIKKEGVGSAAVGKVVKVNKIKDLNSQNKRKRKEPVRAWGKFDRIVIFLLIFLTCGLSGYLALASRGYKLPGFPRISFPKNSLFGEKVVEFNSSGQDKIMNKKAVDEINSTTKELSGVYGIYVYHLDDDSSYGIYEDESFQAASLMKLPVMVGIYLEVQSGRLNLDDTYKLRDKDKIKGSGSLINKPQGYELTYRQLLEYMGKQSDNTAYNVCREKLGDTKIHRIISQIGMNNTNFDENLTTPEDTGLFFQKLWRGKILNQENSDEMLKFLTDTRYENWLAAGVLANIRVAHKYGRETNVVNDAGIVFSGSPYVAVIMSKDVIEKEADKYLPILSKIIYEN